MVTKTSDCGLCVKILEKNAKKITTCSYWYTALCRTKYSTKTKKNQFIKGEKVIGNDSIVTVPIS